MINCIIVDDEFHSVELLISYILKTDGLCLLKSFTSSLEAIQKIQEGLKPDLAFLDVNMPNLSGIELGGLLPHNIAIVYITAFADHAFKAFDTNVYDYLLKPISFPRYLKTVQKIKSMMEDKLLTRVVPSDYFFINPGGKGKMTRVDFNKIIFIEGLKNYIIINVEGGKLITYLTMHEIEQALPLNNFLRIHRSYIVNHHKIQYVDGNTVIMSEQSKLPLGGFYKDTLLNFVHKISIISKR